MPRPISPTASAPRCARPRSARTGWRRGCRTCAPRPQAAAEAAEQVPPARPVSPISRACRDLEQRAEALNDLVLRFQNRYRELALESSFPVVVGPHPVARAAAARSRRAARHPHACGGGVPRPSPGPCRRGPAGGARNRVPHRRGRDAGPRACRFWDMCRPRRAGAPGPGRLEPAWSAGGHPGARIAGTERPGQRAARKRPDKGLPSTPSRRTPTAGSPAAGIQPRGRAAIMSAQTAEFDQAVRAVFSGLQSRALATARARDRGRVPASRERTAPPSPSNWRGRRSVGAALPAGRWRFRRGGVEQSPRVGRGGRERSTSWMAPAGWRRRLRSDLTEDLDILAGGAVATTRTTPWPISPSSGT
jgi:hypothetical protein